NAESLPQDPTTGFRTAGYPRLFRELRAESSVNAKSVFGVGNLALASAMLQKSLLLEIEAA
ncbi:MAG: hypothetical protein HYZ12_01815, partial [Thaumarchaeota archaeon]|nr:hypothetical protein [Nitrososphaerota archaeon]